eukprot:01008_6
MSMIFISARTSPCLIPPKVSCPLKSPNAKFLLENHISLLLHHNQYTFGFRFR